MEKNYYNLLGIDTTADSDAIADSIRTTRKRYRQLVSSPDQQTRIDAEVMMSTLAKAEETLLSPDARALYDAQLQAMSEHLGQHIELVGQEGQEGIEYWLKVATDYLESGSPESARAAVQRVFDYDNDNATAWDIEYRALIELNQTEQAIFALDQVIRHDPQNEPLRATKLQLLYQIGAYDRALKFCNYVIERASSLNVPDICWWEMAVANLMFTTGKAEESFELYERLIKKYPDNIILKDRFSEEVINYLKANISNDGREYFIGNEYQLNLLKANLEYLDKINSSAVLKGKQYQQFLAIYDYGIQKIVNIPFMILVVFVGGLMVYILRMSAVDGRISTYVLALVLFLIAGFGLRYIYRLVASPRWEVIAKKKYQMR